MVLRRAGSLHSGLNLSYPLLRQRSILSAVDLRFAALQEKHLDQESTVDDTEFH